MHLLLFPFRWAKWQQPWRLNNHCTSSSPYSPRPLCIQSPSALLSSPPPHHTYSLSPQHPHKHALLSCRLPLSLTHTHALLLRDLKMWLKLPCNQMKVEYNPEASSIFSLLERGGWRRGQRGVTCNEMIVEIRSCRPFYVDTCWRCTLRRPGWHHRALKRYWAGKKRGHRRQRSNGIVSIICDWDTR